ncbi:hypothetical protein [Kitasatospora sp. NPDC059571]|uniref:hypothetical protein n=1 Tax=Kitasatospora sp. NPDC059571 TaxID=3346871 RepID=UPI003689F4F5
MASVKRFWRMSSSARSVAALVPGSKRRRAMDDPDDPAIVTERKATRGHPLTAAQEGANKLVSRERAANEHGSADLKNWRILTKVRMNFRHATALLRALPVLTNTEIQR